MAYQSLYRRYRPHRFSDVRGQDHVVPALRNAVREERVGHAYLFSGPRGTGKTSTARILAKALNCPNLADGEPCGTCESCLAIDAGTSYDVQELDAASNNGVESVRELVARAALGSPGRTKVYILDEVHMLTAAASAALLKTLEEPPAHVVFVLATTDPEKVLATIRSRTQHYIFHLLAADVLAEHVAWVIHDAQLDLADDVIDHVVRQARGSARDALSALDQVAAAGGVLDRGQTLDDLLEAIAAGDIGAALVAVSDAVADGRDPRVLGEAVLACLRDVFLVRMGAPLGHLPSGDAERVAAWAEQMGDRATTRALEAVGDALLEMRQAPDPRIPLDVAMVKLTRAAADQSVEALADRLAALEATVARLGTPGPPPSPTVPSTPSGSHEQAPPPTAAPPAPSAPSSPPSVGLRGGGPDAEAAPTSAGRGRPADEARAQLASQRSVGSRPAPRSQADRPSPSAAPPSIPPTAAADDGRSPACSEPDAPPPAGEPAPPPAPTAAAVPASSDGPDRSLIEAAWEATVLPSLGGLAKAMYAAGHIADVDGSTVTVALPNEVHRQNCERKRDEVQRALSDGLGMALVLRLGVDPDGSDPSSSRESGSGSVPGPAGRAGAGQVPAGPVEELGVDDVHDLDDAPDAPTGGIDALTEAFPGAELVEEP